MFFPFSFLSLFLPSLSLSSTFILYFPPPPPPPPLFLIPPSLHLHPPLPFWASVSSPFLFPTPSLHLSPYPSSLSPVTPPHAVLFPSGTQSVEHSGSAVSPNLSSFSTPSAPPPLSLLPPSSHWGLVSRFQSARSSGAQHQRRTAEHEGRCGQP